MARTTDLEDPEYWKALINQSLSRLFILRTLHEAPTHGYGLLERLTAFTRGCCTPAYGTIYPILKQLLEGEYATVRHETGNGRKRKVYELTPKGESAYQQAIDTWQDVLPYIERAIAEWRDAQ